MYKINYKDRIFNDSAIVTGLRVQIQDGQTIITRILSGNHDYKTDEDLIELVLEQFYQETYPNRAENERFTKFDEKLQLIDKKLAEMDKVKKELDVTQGSVMELITQLGDKLAKGDGQHETAEKTQKDGKGGESNDGNVIRD